MRNLRRTTKEENRRSRETKRPLIESEKDEMDADDRENELGRGEKTEGQWWWAIDRDEIDKIQQSREPERPAETSIVDSSHLDHKSTSNWVVWCRV